MSEIWNIPSPTNRGPETTFFGQLPNLTANLTTYIFGTKHDIDNRSSALTSWQPRGVSYTQSQNDVNAGPRCATLCTSGFMDDVTFGRNGRKAGKGWQHSTSAINYVRDWGEVWCLYGSMLVVWCVCFSRVVQSWPTRTCFVSEGSWRSSCHPTGWYWRASPCTSWASP